MLCCTYSGDKKTPLHYAADKHAGADVVSEMLADANPTTKLLWLIGAYHTGTEEKLPEVCEEAEIDLREVRTVLISEIMIDIVRLCAR